MDSASRIQYNPEKEPDFQKEPRLKRIIKVLRSLCFRCGLAIKFGFLRVKLFLVRLKRKIILNTRWKKALAGMLIFLLTISTVFIYKNSATAATFYFEQTNWIGGATANVADHNNNRTGWDEYSSKDSGITAGSNLTLAAQDNSLVQTMDADFSSDGPTLSDTQVSGNSVKLSERGAEDAIVESGYKHSCAVKIDGTVWCWGYNVDGQLGNNTIVDSSTPVQVLSGAQSGDTYLKNIVSVAVGEEHSCAADVSGNLYCWGDNARGQLGDGSTTDSLVPVRVAGVGGSGTLDNISSVTAPLVRGTSIHDYASFTCAIDSSGNAYCWGLNAHGQLGNNTIVDSSTPVQVLSGAQSGGTYLQNIESISAGSYYGAGVYSSVCAIDSSADLYCWGSNAVGQLGDGTTTSSYIPVRVLDGAQDSGDATYFDSIDSVSISPAGHVCAIETTGNVYCWGQGQWGRLGNGSSDSSYTPIRVLDGEQDSGDATYLDNATSISAGLLHNCSLDSSTNVYCWGFGTSGQLGDGLSGLGFNVPQKVHGVGGSGFLNNIYYISSGGNHNCAIDSSGNLDCWGDNEFKQLGDGNDPTDSNVPVQVPSFSLLATAYKSSGTYTSAVKNIENLSFGTLSWSETLLTDTTVTVKVRSSDDSGMAGATDWASCPAITNGSDITGDCVTDGHQYIQYQVALATVNFVDTPSLDDITISYINSPKMLISSTFDSGEVANVISGIRVDGTILADTEIRAQIRSSADNVTWTNWCGPVSCDADDTYDYNSDYVFNFTSGDLGNVLPFTTNEEFSTGDNDRYFQYRIILFSTDGAQTPTVTEVSPEYVVNASPVISNVTAAQGATGEITIGYDISDVDASDTFTVSALIDIGVTTNEGLDSTETEITLADATDMPVFGTIQIENEQISYTGKSGSDLTGCTRGANNSKAASHTTGATVWIKGTTVSGDLSNVDDGTGKSITWTVKTDLDELYDASANIRVSANDGNIANQVGNGDSSSFQFDTKDPVVNSFSITSSQLAEKTNDSTEDLSIDTTEDNSSGYQMRFSNDNSNWSGWSSYSTTKSQWDFTDVSYGGDSSETTKTVYAEFRDANGNEASASDTIVYDATSPGIPQNAKAQDASNNLVDPTESRIFVSWETNADADGDFVQYHLYRGSTISSVDDSSQVSNWAEIVYGDSSDRLVNYYVDDSVSESNRYYYRLTTEDDVSNISDYSDVADTVPDGSGGAGLTTPTISNVTVDDKGTDWIKLTWDTDELSDSTVYYDTGTADSADPSVNVPTVLTSGHEVVITGLSVNTDYNFLIESENILNNSDTDTSSGTTYDGPTIDGVSVTETYDTSAKIYWKLSGGSSTTDTIYYTSTITDGSPDFSSPSSQSATCTSGECEGTIEGLTGDFSRYYFYVQSDNATDKNPENGVLKYYRIFTATSSVPSPETLNISDSPSVTGLTYNSATVEWTTGRASNSLVDYGITTGYGASYGDDNESVISHAVEISSLTPETTYYYRVKSEDSLGNQVSQSSDSEGALSFTTLSGSSDANDDGTGDQLENASDDIENLLDNGDYTEEEIQAALAEIYEVTSTGASVNIVDNTTAVFTWETSRESTGRVVYWRDGGSTSSATETTSNVTDHTITVKGLNAQTEYNYYIISTTPLGSEVQSATKTFTTDDTSSISAVSVTDITLNSAVVSWVANSLDNLKVEYGTSSKYGSEINAGSASAESVHATKLENLISGKTYHFRIIGDDSDDEQVTSGDFSFAVLDLPQISNVASRDITSEKAIVSWTTNFKTDSLVEYKIKGKEEGTSKGIMEAVTDHEVLVDNLIPGTTYVYTIVSRDQFGNSSTSDPKSFTTEGDNNAPIIYSVKSEATVFPNKESKIQTIISWSTDKPSNSIVAYKEGRIDKYDGIDEKLREENTNEHNSWKIIRKDDNDFDHIFVLTDFNPASMYYFKIGSVDKRGNMSISDNYSILTPAKKKSVFDLIVNNFEDTFGWFKFVGK